MLNRSRGAMPLYQQLKMILKDQIEQGEYQNGDILPAESRLMNQYEVSRITVRQALGDLTNEGYVVGKPGIGTVVVFEKINERLKSIKSFSEEMAQHGIIMSTELCEMSMISANKLIATKLCIDEESSCFHLVRIRSAKGLPMVYSHTYIPSSWNLPLDASLYRDSLYKYLTDTMGIVVAKATDTLEAVLAEEDISRCLKIEEGMPVFKRSRASVDPTGRPIEFTICYYPGDKYKYSVEL
ncbi:MAG: GntR family transcriptional regulator [Sphaerochaetaceae bacterium]|nr:GntR family transcriptional regulator [Sphaerochaetaceae bacterium]